MSTILALNVWQISALNSPYSSPHPCFNVVSRKTCGAVNLLTTLKMGERGYIYHIHDFLPTLSAKIVDLSFPHSFPFFSTILSPLQKCEIKKHNNIATNQWNNIKILKPDENFILNIWFIVIWFDNDLLKITLVCDMLALFTLFE